MLARGMQYFVEDSRQSAIRAAYRLKDPRGFDEFCNQLAEHSSLESSLTYRQIQGRRPTVLQLGEDLNQLRVPTLLVVGDQDENCVDANVFIRRQCPTAGLVMLPRTGHTVNLEEPDLLNEIALRFLNSVEANQWLASV